MRAQTPAPKRSLPLLVQQLAESHQVGIGGVVESDLLKKHLRALAIPIEHRQSQLRETAFALVEAIGVRDRGLELAPRRVGVSREQRHLAEAKMRARVMWIFRERGFERLPREHRLAFDEVGDALVVVGVGCWLFGGCCWELGDRGWWG